jgi:hypothetical protein
MERLCVGLQIDTDAEGAALIARIAAGNHLRTTRIKRLQPSPNRRWRWTTSPVA